MIVAEKGARNTLTRDSVCLLKLKNRQQGAGFTQAQRHTLSEGGQEHGNTDCRS